MDQGFDVYCDFGVPVDPDLVRHGPFSVDAGYCGATDLLAAQLAPTGIFCGNDVGAVGAASALAHAGGSAVRDVTDIGFDDIAMASLDLFRITTVHGDISMMARESVRHVLRRIEDPDAQLGHRPTDRVDRKVPALGP